MYSYAHLDESNLCVRESESESPVVLRNVIRVEGAGYVGKRWTGAGWVDVPAPQPEEPALTWKITKLAFKNRFPRAKWVAARQAAAIDPALYDFFESFELATYIDLERDDTRTSVTAMSADVVPEAIRLTAEEVASVLDVAASPHEIPAT